MAKAKYRQIEVPEGARVIRWWSNMDCDIEWIDKKSGERVVGKFSFGLWAWAPPKERAQFPTMLSKPPVAYYRGKPRPAGRAKAP